ncbi:MAG TPA: hypothetical protein VG168_17945 [Bryobacteraceae bacterium]|jgi:hypothetical protein|nr:hypothetical protein [Bryobacteraceae bacterium]
MPAIVSWMGQWVQMTLDPNTKLANLLDAIPSAAAVLKRFDILTRGNEDKILGELCAQRGIPFDTFLKGMNEVDWNDEYKSQ